MLSFRVKNQWIGTRTVSSLQWTCNDSGRKLNVHGYFIAQWFEVTGELALIPSTTWKNPWILFLAWSRPIKNQLKTFIDLKITRKSVKLEPKSIVINSHREAPLSNAPWAGWILGRGEPGGGKERELRRQSVPSLRGGGWGDKLGFWCL